MPPNVTPVIQSMTQNVIKITKSFYRKSLLTQLLPKGSDLKPYSLKDAVSNLRMT